MRWHATRESVDEGEVSALAVAETLLAVAVLVMLSLWFDTLKWLAGASCLAPLLLLRTDDSVRKGLRWMRWVSERKRGEKWIPKARITSAIIVLGICVWIAVWVAGWWAALIIFALISPVFLLPFSLAYLPVLCFCVRLGATLGSVLRHPLQSLGAIPRNWRRIVLGTDTTRGPEFMPGDEFGPLSLLRGQPRWPWSDGILYDAALFLYVPTVAYRWSLKATCMIYMPLIWLVEAGRLSPNLREALDDYQASDLRRIGTLMSLGYIAALVVKVILLMTVAEFVEWWDGNRALQFLKIYIVPHQVPLWQIASALNAVLAIILWVYARHVLRLIGKKKGQTEGRVRAVWQTAKAITVVLALYSIACTVIITCKEGHLVDTLRRLWSVTGKQWLP